MTVYQLPGITVKGTGQRQSVLPGFAWSDTTAAGGSTTLTGLTGSFSLIGVPESLLKDFIVFSDNSSYILQGQIVGLYQDKSIIAETSTYLLSCQDALLVYTPSSNAYILTADFVSYVIFGQSASLITEKLLNSNFSNFTVTFNDNPLLVDRSVLSENAIFSLNGVNVPVLLDRIITSTPASYLLSGQDATLLYTPVGAYILTASSGTYTYSTETSNLLFSRILSGNNGDYTLSGISSNLLKGLGLSAEANSYVFSGQDATLTYTGGYTLLCGESSYTLSASQASLLVSRVLASDPSNYSITGNSANFISGVAVPVGSADNHWKILIKAPTSSILLKNIGTSFLIK